MFKALISVMECVQNPLLWTETDTIASNCVGVCPSFVGLFICLGVGRCEHIISRCAYTNHWVGDCMDNLVMVETTSIICVGIQTVNNRMDLVQKPSLTTSFWCKKVYVRGKVDVLTLLPQSDTVHKTRVVIKDAEFVPLTRCHSLQCARVWVRKGQGTIVNVVVQCHQAPWHGVEMIMWRYCRFSLSENYNWNKKEKIFWNAMRLSE